MRQKDFDLMRGQSWCQIDRDRPFVYESAWALYNIYSRISSVAYQEKSESPLPPPFACVCDFSILVLFKVTRGTEGKLN